MTTRLLVLLSLAASWAVLSGCASAAKKPVYDSRQTGTIIREQRGEIVAVRDVVIERTDIGIRGGPGRQIGQAVGRGAVTGSVVGVVAAIGGVVGGELGSKADQKAGEEITIRLAGTEEIILVVQERGDIPLAVGERVRVQSGTSAARGGILGSVGGGNVRVVRDDNFARIPAAMPAQRIGRTTTRLVSH